MEVMVGSHYLRSNLAHTHLPLDRVHGERQLGEKQCTECIVHGKSDQRKTLTLDLSDISNNF
jgi:hypothetical protein